MKNNKKIRWTISILFLCTLFPAISGCGHPETEVYQQNTISTNEVSTVNLRNLQPVTKNDVHIVYEQYYDDENLNLAITDGLDAVKNVHFLLFLENDDKFLYLGEDNNMEGDYNTGAFKDNFNGYWAAIDDQPVTLEVIEEEEKYTMYSVPCIVDGQETSIRALYDYDTASYRILGRYDGVDQNSNTHKTSRGVRKIDNGAQVIFTFTSVEGENYEEYECQTDPILWSDDIVMEDIDMGDGIYLFMYEIEDVFGNEIDADPLEVQVKGDEIIWLSELE